MNLQTYRLGEVPAPSSALRSALPRRLKTGGVGAGRFGIECVCVSASQDSIKLSSSVNCHIEELFNCVPCFKLLVL